VIFLKENEIEADLK